MINIELIYDAECPNAQEARNQLRRALTAAGLPSQWLEWNRANPESPAYVRRFGSPTILVDGQDVAGEVATGANSCRLYIGGNGQFNGVPSVEMITTAIKKASTHVQSATTVGPKNRWWKVLSALPATGTALLPNLVCPGCWPAYAGLLNSLGIGFINYSPYLAPLTGEVV